MAIVSPTSFPQFNDHIPLIKPRRSKANMSNQQSSSFKSYSSVSYSSSSSRDGEQVSGSRRTQTTYSDDSGTTVKSSSQNIGEPVVREEKHYDAQGRELLSGTDGAGQNRRIEDVSEEQKQRDREYEERIDEEYAKREGGA
jgi:hypothetical protein